ncbi:MAG: PfkB family carbohydrate kinase [Chlamydiales bacterium]
MQGKIKKIGEIGPLIAAEKKKGHKVVHCHGVFDLLHPGHVRHFIEAKSQGDKLVVSLTPDCYVNKGPGRPVFNEKLRAEQLAALACVDFVVLNDSPDAVSIINKIQPTLYVKGGEYRHHEADVTGKISEEVEAVHSVGGDIWYTDDVVFSSSGLLNRHFDQDAKRIEPFISHIREQHTCEELMEKIEALSSLKVLVVGDAIIDEYQYVSPLGQSGKGQQMTATLCDKETFLGGSLIIANHLAGFVGQVKLLTAVGRECPYKSWMRQNLYSNVSPDFIEVDQPTLVKKRYVQKDGQNITKYFETYSSQEALLDKRRTDEVVHFIHNKTKDFDLVLVCDFGNGFTNPAVISALSEVPNFLAVNTQTNSGNRGFNVVTHYHRADFVSLNEPELRLAAHDRYSRLEAVANDIASILRCPSLSVTRGVEGVEFFEKGKPPLKIPALTTHTIDRVGAGDSYFALASACMAKGYSPLISGFLGSVAAAIDVQIIGNKEAINKPGFCKYVTRLLK